MLVIRLEVERISGTDAYSVGGYTLGNAVGSTLDVIFPADRCAWRQDAYANGQYSISDVTFYHGSSVNGDALDAGTGANIEAFVTLGQIGKSGRFVALTARTNP